MTSQITVNDRARIFSDLKELVAFNSVHGRPELADASHAAADWVAAALQDGVEKAEIYEYLAAMAQDMGAPGFDDRYGWGYLDRP